MVFVYQHTKFDDLSTSTQNLMASVHQHTKFVSCLWILSSWWLPTIPVTFVALIPLSLSCKSLEDMYDTQICSHKQTEAYCIFLPLLSASFKHNFMYIWCFMTTKKNMLVYHWGLKRWMVLNNLEEKWNRFCWRKLFILWKSFCKLN